MSTNDGVSNATETAEAVPQNESNGKTTAESLTNSEKVDENLGEVSADVPENTIAAEMSGVSKDVGTEVNKSEDTNGVQTTEGTGETADNTAEVKVANEGDTNPTESGMEEDAGKTMAATPANEDTTTDSVKGKDDIEMATEEETEKCTIGANGENVDKTDVDATMDGEKKEVGVVPMETDGVKDDAGEEVKEDDKVVEEFTEDVTEEVTGVVKDDKIEVNEDVVEEVKEDVAEEVKEDVAEEVKEDIKENVKEDVEEDVKEENKEDVVEEVEENVKEDAVEEGGEKVAEEINEDIKKDVEDEVDTVEKDKDITIKAEENTAENIVIDISEDTASEKKGEGGKDSKEDVSTPAKRKSTRGSTETPSSRTVSAKRERRSAHQYVPGDFDRKQNSEFTVLSGKGTKLKDIPKVKSNVEKLLVKDPALSQVHKFVYGGRGIVSKKVVKKQILEFSGYLLPDDKGTEKAAEKEAEKFTTRARKMTVPLLKVICDILDVDRTPMGKRAPLGKEAIIDQLIEFIAAPDLKLTVGGKRNNKRSRSLSPAKTPKKKRARKTEEVEVEIVEEEMDEDDEEEGEEVVEVTKGNKMPTKKELRKFVQAYVTCFSMEKTTTKHLIQTASDKFDVNVSSKKKDILDLLAETMSD